MIVLFPDHTHFLATVGSSLCTMLKRQWTTCPSTVVLNFLDYLPVIVFVILSSILINVSVY